MATCPRAEELLQLLEEQLETVDQARIVAHVETCGRCQDHLEELTRGPLADDHATDGGPPAGDRPVPGTDELTPDERETAVRQTDPENGQPPRAIADPDGDATSENDASDGAETTAKKTDGRRTGEPAQLSTTIIPPYATPQTRSEKVQRGEPKIPGYDLLEKLGEGGMGVVYKARHRDLNRIVALKMIRGGEQARPDHFVRFRIEAEAVASLRHPNIIQIYDIGQVDDLPFVALELLDGGSLRDYLAGTPRPGRDAARLMVTLSHAIHAAHQAGIVHRDLKPSNVLFTEDGIPKITDFGLAKRLESDSRQTESGQIMGSPSYMAPEQARGHTKDVGPAADVYALGAILYEMLTGRPPFKGETPMETVRQVVDDDPVPPSRLVPRMGHDPETICLKCLNKEPHKRYGSAADLAADLERYLKGEPIKARPTPFWERGIKWARRRPMVAASIALILVVSVALSYSRGRSNAKREADRQRDEFRVAGLRSESVQSLFTAQELLARENWTDAEPKLIKVQTQLAQEPELIDLAQQTEKLLEQGKRIRAEEEARNSDWSRYQRFDRLVKEALFREIQLTGLDQSAHRQTIRQSAHAALAVFAAPGLEDLWALVPLPASLTGEQRDQIKEGCYELLLIQADSAEQPDQGLRLLDRAHELRPATRAYHLRRAACLTRRGDATGAEQERLAAEAVPAATAFDYFLIGKESYLQGDWAAALRHFDQVLQQKPDHFWARYLSAMCNLQLRRPSTAKSELTACLQNERGFAWLYGYRAFASYQMAVLAHSTAENAKTHTEELRTEARLQLAAAEKDYRTALEILDQTPNDELRYVFLANRSLLWLERREWDKSVADLEAAIRLDGRSYRAFEILAGVRWRQDKLDEAIEQFSQAITRKPDMAALYRGRADVERSRHDATPAQRDQAMRDLEQAIRLEPPGSLVVARDHTHRARLLFLDHHDEQALEACDAAIKVLPTFAEAHDLRIEVLRKMNRVAELISSCDALLAGGRPSIRLYQLRGLAKQDRMDYAGAIADFTQALTLQPASASLLVRRGRLYLITDAPRPALRDFEEAIGLEWSDAEAYNGRGLALVALGRHQEAVADAAKALRMGDPNPGRIYDAARIHAKAAIAATNEVRKNGQDTVFLVTRYQDQAIALIREVLRRQPAARRAAFLNNVVLGDPALSTLRRRLRSL